MTMDKKLDVATLKTWDQRTLSQFVQELVKGAHSGAEVIRRIVNAFPEETKVATVIQRDKDFVIRLWPNPADDGLHTIHCAR